MIRVIKGDCLQVMAKLASNSVDMVCSDLPYGTTYAEFDRVLKNNKAYKTQSLIDLHLLWKEYRRICKGPIVLTASQPFTTQLIYSNLSMFKYSMGVG